MAFTQRKLTRSVEQANGIFNKYIYETDDTVADIQAPGYFSASRFAISDNDETNGMGWNGGIIEAKCSDGYAIGIISDNGVGFSLATIPSDYNDIVIERIIDNISEAESQEPAGTGVANAIQVEFGVAANTPSDPVNILSDGTLTINETGTYRIKVALQFGRTGASGTSLILFKVDVNDVQAGRSIAARINNPNVLSYFENDTWITLPAGVTLKFFVMRDAQGDDSGGLFKITPTAEAGSWNDASCAAIRVERWT